jgi:hypothetical protein
MNAARINGQRCRSSKAGAQTYRPNKAILDPPQRQTVCSAGFLMAWFEPGCPSDDLSMILRRAPDSVIDALAEYRLAHWPSEQASDYLMVPPVGAADKTPPCRGNSRVRLAS